MPSKGWHREYSKSEDNQPEIRRCPKCDRMGKLKVSVDVKDDWTGFGAVGYWVVHILDGVAGFEAAPSGIWHYVRKNIGVELDVGGVLRDAMLKRLEKNRVNPA